MQIQDIFQKIFGKPTTVSGAEIAKTTLTDTDKKYLEKIGMTISSLQEQINRELAVNYDRVNLYQECMNCVSHPLMNAGVEYYADAATVYNRDNQATIWVSSENNQYRATLEKLFERINIEEKIFDWAYAIGLHGDLFAKINGQPGLGIISIDDSRAPIEYFRIENNGQLIGFYHQVFSDATKDNSKLLPPWSHVHFLLNGARKRRSTYGDSYGYRTSIIGIGGNTFQESTHYGSPLLMPALPVYKRLRLAEDSVLMARATRGVTKYLYALGVDGSNAEAISSLITQYANIIKRARAIDTTPGETAYSDRLNNMNVAEDVLIPIWGDVGQLRVEKLGGEVDIKWITDVDKLEQQLATAIRIPLPLLAGFAGEGGSGFDNGGSLERMDIRFGRSVRRLQRAIVQGVTRMCQLHLAYLSMDPDPKLFEVHMSETSTAEDEEQKETLKTSIEACDMLMDLMVKFVGDQNLDREKAFDFLNERILHMKDLKFKDFMKEGATALANPAAPGAEGEATVGGPTGPQPLETQHVIDSRKGGDLQAFTPLNENKWNELYGSTEVKMEISDSAKKVIREARI